MAASPASLASFATSSTSIQPTDESVILITSPYTNGLTVPTIINPNATNSACLMAMPTMNGNLGHAEVSCSSMTSPPITPPQTGASSTSSYPTLLNAPSPAVATQQNSKDGAIPSSTNIVLSNSQMASGSQIQGNSYIPIPSGTMLYPSAPLGMPISSSLTKPSYTINHHPNTYSQSFPSPQQQYPVKNNAATSPSVMSPPVTPFLDQQLLCIPAATSNLNDPTSPAYNPVFSPVYGSSCQSSALPPHSVLPVISGVTNGLDFSNGGSIYPNHILVSNNPGDIQCLNVKNGDGYLSPGNSPSPYAYPPSNFPSLSAVHVTSDRSVYSTTLSDVSLIN